MLLLDILNILLVGQIDFMQLPSSDGYKYVVVVLWILEWSFPLKKWYFLFCWWSPVGKDHPDLGTPIKHHSDQRTHFTSQALQQVCAVWPVLQFFHCFHHPWSSSLVEHTNGIIKTQLANFVKFLQIYWPKALLLVFLNLRFTSVRIHKFSLFEAVYGCPMHLAPCLF